MSKTFYKVRIFFLFRSSVSIYTFFFCKTIVIYKYNIKISLCAYCFFINNLFVFAAMKDFCKSIFICLKIFYKIKTCTFIIRHEQCNFMLKKSKLFTKRKSYVFYTTSFCNAGTFHTRNPDFHKS